MAMPEETTGGTEAEPALRSLADKVNWLIDRARPAGRGPCSNAEVADLIERTTGERVSYTTIWKLRNGQAANPSHSRWPPPTGQWPGRTWRSALMVVPRRRRTRARRVLVFW